MTHTGESDSVDHDGAHHKPERTLYVTPNTLTPAVDSDDVCLPTES